MTTVKVSAIPERGFYRAGRHWPHTEVEVELDNETLEVIEAEPMLNVRRGTGPRVRDIREHPADAVGVAVPEDALLRTGRATGLALPDDLLLRPRLTAAGFTTLDALFAPESAELIEKTASSKRRYFRLMAEAAAAKGDDIAHADYLARLEAEPGTVLPATIPEDVAELLAAAPIPYRYAEDVRGADVAELVRLGGIGKKRAADILSAFQNE